MLCVLRQKEKTAVGGRFLNGFKQCVLTLRIQLLIKNIDFAIALVRTDVQIRTGFADDFYRNGFSLAVCNMNDVGMHSVHHLAALRTLQTGLVFLCALHGGG